jgi:hypothetical protein
MLVSHLMPPCSPYITIHTNKTVVYDILNVASIHNTSTSSTPSNTTLAHLRTLADAHEWGLAYNASDNMRAVAGMQLAGEVLSYMNTLISSQGAKKFGIQFGAYATFMSFFGLVDLPKANGDFMGVVDYASSMTFELFTEKDVNAGFPAQDDLQIRFLFHNGTASNTSEPIAYPLFGGSSETVSFNDFQANLSKFAISSTQQWCEKCGNTTGSCAAYATKPSTAHSQSNGGMSPAVGGVIGAFVTLAVVLGTLAAIMLVGGFTLVSKKRVAKGVEGINVETKA